MTNAEDACEDLPMTALTVKRTPNAHEFARVYLAVFGPITLEEAEAQLALGVERELRARIVYRQAATADCSFCLGLPVGNAAQWTDRNAPATAPCPRCGESHTIPNPEDL